MIEYIKSVSGDKKIIAVGNPPYQEHYADNSSNTGANPIYHLFLDILIKSNKIDEFLMVIPSRWFAGGRGKTLKQFAKELRTSKKIRAIFDFESSKEVFPTVEIKGGVCFLHWDSHYEGEATFQNKFEKNLVDLTQVDIISRNMTSRNIIQKVKSRTDTYISDRAWSWNPFALSSNYFERNQESISGILLECLTKKRVIKKIDLNQISKNKEHIAKYKIACPKAVSKGGIPYRQDQIFILRKNQICTETYMIIECFDKLHQAEIFLKYLQSAFVRYLLSIKKITQDITKETWSFVPFPTEKLLNYSDKDLYIYYALSSDEIAHIEQKVQEWS